MRKSKDSRQLYLQAAMWMYGLVICVQVIFSGSFFDSISLTQVLADQPHLLVPIKRTFYLWPLILIWEALGVYFSQLREQYASFNASYQLLAAPKLVELYLYHIVYLVVWSQKLYLFAFIIMALYLRRTLSLMKLISRNPNLNQPAWLLKFPVGLHTGWLMSLTVYVFYTYIMSHGLEAYPLIQLILAVLLLVGIIIMGAYLYAQYGNQCLPVAILIYLIGLLIQHYPGSTFSQRHALFYLIVAVLFIIALAVFIRFARYQLNQNKAKKEGNSL